MLLRRRIATLIGLALLAGGIAAAPAASAATTTTGLEVWSDVGNPSTGPSAVNALLPPTFDFSVTGTTSDLTVHAIQGQYVRYATVQLRAPEGETLHVGTYLEAQWAPFATAPHPGLGFSWQGCTFAQAAFVIEEIESDPVTGAIVSLAAEFDINCGTYQTGSYGSVRVNSSVPLLGRSAITLTGTSLAYPGDPVSLTGAVTDDSGPMAGVVLSVTRSEPGGAVALPDVTTAADGTFVVNGTQGTTPAVYTLAYAGDATHRPGLGAHTTDVRRRDTVLTAKAPSAVLVGTTATITGSLTSAIGPVAGAEISAWRTDSSTYGNTVLPPVTTKADGTFAIDVPVLALDTYVEFRFTGGNLYNYSSTTISANAVRAGTVLTVSVPTTGTRGTAYTMTGRLLSDGRALAGGTVNVTWTDLLGVHDRTMITTATGAFALRSVPTVGGPVRWQAGYAGTEAQDSAWAEDTITIPRSTTVMSISTDRVITPYLGYARVIAHLGTTYNGRTLRLYARAIGGPKTPDVLVATGTVNRYGNLAISYRITRPTQFVARFFGDYRFASASRSSAVVRPQWRFSANFTGNYGTSAGYALYRLGVRPVMEMAVGPAAPGACVTMTLERLDGATWKQGGGLACASLEPNSHMLIQVIPAGRGKYRVNASMPTTAAAVATTSRWWYFAVN